MAHLATVSVLGHYEYSQDFLSTCASHMDRVKIRVEADQRRQPSQSPLISAEHHLEKYPLP